MILAYRKSLGDFLVWERFPHFPVFSSLEFHNWPGRHEWFIGHSEVMELFSPGWRTLAGCIVEGFWAGGTTRSTCTCWLEVSPSIAPEKSFLGIIDFWWKALLLCTIIWLNHLSLRQRLQQFNENSIDHSSRDYSTGYYCKICGTLEVRFFTLLIPNFCWAWTWGSGEQGKSKILPSKVTIGPLILWDFYQNLQNIPDK